MNIIEKQGAVTRLATAIQNRMLKDVGRDDPSRHRVGGFGA